MNKLKVKIFEADDAIRTRDIGLGRTTLYQLSYIRNCIIIITNSKKKSSFFKFSKKGEKIVFILLFFRKFEKEKKFTNLLFAHQVKDLHEPFHVKHDEIVQNHDNILLDVL